MSKKRKPKGRPGFNEISERARRELAKGDAKAAVKDAQLCFRSEPTPVHRQLLERAYAARIEQLHRKNQAADAKAVLDRLLEMKPTLPEVCEALPRMRLMAGDANPAAAAVAFEREPELLVKMADDAVLDPQRNVPNFAGLPPQLAAVRSALAAVERGEDDAAAGLLADIPRSSPLCDWKLFVRGLSAFYAADGERMQANWRRLDSQRPAARLAHALMVAGGDEPASNAPMDVTATIRALELRWSNDPATESLQRLSEMWRDDDERAFFAELRNFRQRSAATHAQELEAIAEIVSSRAIRECDWSLLDRLKRAVPAPPLDPNWHRADALMYEHPDNDDAGLIEDHWCTYAEDLAGLPALREDERPIAASLTYTHLATKFLQFANEAEKPTMFQGPDEIAAKYFRLDAARYFRMAIRQCPVLPDAYRGLAGLLEESGKPVRAAVVFEKLVKQQPDDYDASVWLARYYLAQDDPDKAEPHVRSVIRLKPRDPECAGLDWKLLIVRIRLLAMRKEFDAAREMWNAARVRPPSNLDPFIFDVMRACIEFKAKETEAAQRHVEAAIATVSDPAPVWLQLSYTAAKYKLPRLVKKQFDDGFKKAIKERPTSAAAGRLAAFLATLKFQEVNYTGRATQERLVIAYLKRSVKIPWEESDLLAVCNLLAELPKESGLCGKLAAAGVRKFPQNPFFHNHLAQLEIARGRYRCNRRKAKDHLSRALKCCDPSRSPEERALEELARMTLSALQDLPDIPRGPFGFDFGFGGGREESFGRSGRSGRRGGRQRRFRFDDEGEPLDEDDSPMPLSGDMDPETILDELERHMPEHIRRELEEASRESGEPPRSLLARLMGALVGSRFKEETEQGRSR